MEYEKLLAPLDRLKIWMKHTNVDCQNAHHALLRLKREKFWKLALSAPRKSEYHCLNRCLF